MCPSRETPTFVFSKKIGIIASKIFVYDLFSIYGNRKLFEKAEIKHLKLVVSSVYEM